MPLSNPAQNYSSWSVETSPPGSKTSLDHNISDEDMAMVYPLISAVLLAISVFGVAANVLNIVAFAQLGIRDHTNLKLLVLSVDDLTLLVCTLASASCNLVAMVEPDLPVDLPSLDFHGISWVWEFFSDMSTWIVVYISAERSLCVVFPIVFRNYVNLSKSVGILVLIHVLVLARYIRPFMAIEFGWVRVKSGLNITRLTVIFNEEYLDVVDDFLDAPLILRTLSVVIVVTFTCLMVNGLRRSAKFRQVATAPKLGKGSAMSSKELVLVKMVVLVVTLFVITNIPLAAWYFGIQLGLVTLTDDRNLLLLSLLVIKLLSAINSSLNILIYYRLGSNFRKVTVNLLLSCGASDGDLHYSENTEQFMGRHPLHRDHQ